MGKIRTRILGLEEIEKKQKEEQKKRTEEKKKVKAPGLKGGEQEVTGKVKEEELTKLEKGKKNINEKPKKEEKTEVVTKKTRGKKYQELKKMVDKNKTHSIKDAITLLKKMNQFGFDQTVELHLNVDKTGLKGEVELPYSTGKTVRVAIVDDKVLANIEKGEIDFDVLITHPSYMPKLARFARVLGPKGLMPNPKAGTISDKPEEVAKKFEKGLLRWKTESKFPLIHQAVGKLSLDEEKLVANVEAFLKSVGKAHIRTAFVKATMTPSIKLSLEELK
jgi:large subunit ribosomal protein L1